MRLILVRHGETEENKAHIIQGHKHGKLSAEGIEQAKKLALRLKDEKIDVIYSSDLDRCVKTTKEIAKFHKAKVIHTPEIRERALGIFEGGPWSKLDEVGEGREDYHPPGGESLLELRKRAGQFVRKIITDCKGQNLLISSHGGLVRMMIAELMGITFDESMKIELGNTSVSIFEIDPNGNAKLVCLDCQKHLCSTSDGSWNLRMPDLQKT